MNVWLRDEVHRIADEHCFFHWHLEFPDVMVGRGGFDVVLGNPPWESIRLQEKEFFAARVPEIAEAKNAAARKRMIAALQHAPEKVRRDLYAEYQQALHTADQTSRFLHNSVRIPLTGGGDINLYSVFAEGNWEHIRSSGRVGMIVPTGLATDDTNKEFFGEIVSGGALASLYDFENREGLFPAVDSRMKFSLLTLAGSANDAVADVVCFAHDAAELADPARHVSLRASDFSLFNPNTRTMPIFRTQRDADLTRKLYRAAPILVSERTGENPWSISFKQGLFNMSHNSHLFRTRAELAGAGYALGAGSVFTAAGQPGYVPLYEGKMIHQYDHRFATFESDRSDDKTRDATPAEHADPCWEPQPRYWVPRAEVTRVLGEWAAPWLLAFRDITNSTNERTFIASAIPRVGVGNKAPLLMSDAHRSQALCLLCNLDSVVFDYATRSKVGGTSMNFFIVKQLPVLPPATYGRPWGETTVGAWVTRRALKLTYTSEALRPLARDLGYDGPPFAWDEARRALLRAELDAMYARLYSLSRDELAYILTTFPVLRKNEERQFGEYRTARLVMAAWDEMEGGVGE